MNKLAALLFILLLLTMGCGLVELGPPPPTPTPPVPPTYTAEPRYPSSWTVTLKVFSASDVQASLSYQFWSDRTAGLAQQYAEQVHLPWEKTFPSIPEEQLLNLRAVSPTIDGDVTCEIWLNGQRWVSQSNNGTVATEDGSPGQPFAECAGQLGGGVQ